MSVAPLPVSGAVVGDARGDGRALRVSWHEEIDAFVVSVWRDGTCVGTVHLAPSDAAQVVAAFADGLAAGRVDSARGRQLA